jgi:hypothetical protein
MAWRGKRGIEIGVQMSEIRKESAAMRLGLALDCNNWDFHNMVQNSGPNAISPDP